MAVTKDMENNKRPKICLNSKDALKVVRREMVIFEEDGLRGTQVRRAYEYLRNVKPTSVESERAFSANGNILTKLRSSLEDKTLNTLSFLHDHFQKEKRMES
jgi:hAT family C-terminal dimerisation region